jgi:hypothetical protein
MLIEVGPGDRCPFAKQLPVLSFLGGAVEKAGVPFPGDVELLSVGEVDLEMVGGDGDRGFGIRGHNLSSKVNQLTAKPVYFRIEGV